MNHRIKVNHKGSFRKAVIDRMRRDGVNMLFWTKAEAREWNKHGPSRGCGTACCLAGNIYLEAKARGINVKGIQITEAARKVWAKYYGEDEATQLDFFYRPDHRMHLSEVTADEVIGHLESIRDK